MIDAFELSDLASKLGFTLTELELNRVGQISSEQSWAALRDGGMWGGLMLLGAGILAVVIFAKVSTTLRRVWYLTLVPGAAVIIALGGWQLAGAVQRRVLSAEGTVDFRGAGRGGLSLLVGRASVSAPRNARDTLSKKRRYRMYYLARTRQFLSIEPL